MKVADNNLLCMSLELKTETAIFSKMAHPIALSPLNGYIGWLVCFPLASVFYIKSFAFVTEIE